MVMGIGLRPNSLIQRELRNESVSIWAVLVKSQRLPGEAGDVRERHAPDLRR